MQQHISQERKSSATPSRAGARSARSEVKQAAQASGWSPSRPLPAALSLQTKLTINEPGDAYERQADRVADQVVSTPDSTVRNGGGAHGVQAAALMRSGTPGGGGGEAPSVVHDVINQSGTPLDSGVRSFMEPRFGYDFSGVRVHTDSRAAQSAQAVSARAYTVGNNVVFGSGEYSPQSSGGRHLLAHELTHVVQQGAGARTLATARLQRADKDVFSDTDATAVKDSWAKSGSLTETDGTRETVKYNTWKKDYNKKVAAEKKKKAPTVNATDLGAVATWLGTYEAHERWTALGTGTEPAKPAAVPTALSNLGGTPPSPAYEKIKTYNVTVPGGGTYSYTDHVRSKYTVRDTGVGDTGSTGGATKISSVFDAGVTAPDLATVKKVFSVLSDLEGKFDAINTYDAGYISAGFIQFISDKNGNGPLAKVLRTMKDKNPADFTTSFHNLGIDVDSNGIAVVDPATGTVLHGADAVQKVIDDKRLTAVFQQAGSSGAYQQAQARVAYDSYYLPDKNFSVTLTVKDTTPGAKKPKQVTVTGAYKDVLLSEAGKVAIVDRGVQHGTAGKHGSGGAAGRFLDACQAVVDKHPDKLTAPSAADLAKYEAEMVPSLQNRYDVTDKNLTQPAAVPAD